MKVAKRQKTKKIEGGGSERYLKAKRERDKENVISSSLLITSLPLNKGIYLEASETVSHVFVAG